MANEKIAKFIIDVSAEKKRTQMSDMRFFSMDHKTAKIVVQAEKDGEMIAKSSISRVEIMLESFNAGYQAKGKVIFNDQMTVDDDGLFSYVLPDELLNYSGLMAFEVYIYYTNGDVSDSSNRIVYEQLVSAIDRAAGAVELVYIKDMEQAKQAVADKADEVMADMSGYESSLADYEHQIKDGMDQLYDGVVRVSTDEITKIRAELPKVETAANDEITKIQAVLPEVQATAADETAKIKAQLPTVEAVAVAETEKIQAELPKVAAVTTDEITKIKAELPKVQTVATEEIGKIRDVLSTVEQTAQEVSDHADQKIAEYDAKFVSTDKKMVELEQSQVALDAELKATQQQIIDADVYTKAEADANAEGILDKRNLSPAWSWSPDGADRFTKVYPRENLLLDTLPNNWPTLEGKRATGSAIATLGDEKVLVTAIGGTPYYFAGEFSAEQVLSDEFIAKIRGKRLVASVDVAFVNQLTVPTDNLNISIYYWREGGDSFKPSSRKTIAGNERIWIDALIPEDVVNVLVAIKGSGSFVSGASFEFNNLKLEIVDEVPEITPTIYTPAPSEDPLNAYPKYKGLRLAPSDNPADYDWSYTDEYVDYLKNSSVSKTEFNDLAARLAALENQGGI